MVLDTWMENLRQVIWWMLPYLKKQDHKTAFQDGCEKICVQNFARCLTPQLNNLGCIFLHILATMKWGIDYTLNRCPESFPWSTPNLMPKQYHPSLFLLGHLWKFLKKFTDQYRPFFPVIWKHLFHCQNLPFALSSLLRPEFCWNTFLYSSRIYTKIQPEYWFSVLDPESILTTATRRDSKPPTLWSQYTKEARLAQNEVRFIQCSQIIKNLNTVSPFYDLSTSYTQKWCASPPCFPDCW